MKKIIASALAICICICTTLNVFAKQISRNDMGIKFNMSDSWEDVSSGDIASFHYYNNSGEFVIVSAHDNEAAFFEGMIGDNELRAICDELFSDNNLAETLGKINNTSSLWVTTESVIAKTEYYSSGTYYRYEKAYTARATGFYDRPFYLTAFIIAKNGKIYSIEYHRDYDNTQHFSDIVDMINSISFAPGEIKITVNGRTVKPDTSPAIIGGRTLVPIRAVAEALNYSIQWDPTTQVVTMISATGSNVLGFQIGYYKVYKNGSFYPLDVSPIIFNGRTYLPVRAAAEAMDAKVSWISDSRTVSIVK